MHKPEGREEFHGTELSSDEYERYGFDPFAAAAEVLGVAAPGEAGFPAGDGPWLAETADYVDRAAVLFRELALEERRRDFLSVLPEGATLGRFPHTRFIQARAEQMGGESLDERFPPEQDAIRMLSEVVRRLERELIAVKRARGETQESQAGVGESGQEGQGRDEGLGRHALRWLPAGCAAAFLVLAVIFAGSARREAGRAQTHAAAAAVSAVDSETQVGREVEAARLAADRAEAALAGAVGARNATAAAESRAGEATGAAEAAASRAEGGAARAASAAQLAAAAENRAGDHAGTAERAAVRARTAESDAASALSEVLEGVESVQAEASEAEAAATEARVARDAAVAAQAAARAQAGVARREADRAAASAEEVAATRSREASSPGPSEASQGDESDEGGRRRPRS